MSFTELYLASPEGRPVISNSVVLCHVSALYSGFMYGLHVPCFSCVCVFVCLCCLFVLGRNLEAGILEGFAFELAAVLAFNILSNKAE